MVGAVSRPWYTYSMGRREPPAEIGTPAFVTTEVARVEAAWRCQRRRNRSKADLRSWQLWRTVNDDMVTALRSGLTPYWTVLWDRRLPDVPHPVTLIVGPPGVWALQCAPPGVSADWKSLTAALRTLLPQGWTVHAYVVPTVRWEDAWPRFTAQLAIHPAVNLSPGDRRRLVDYLAASTGPELTGVPSIWLGTTPAPRPPADLS